MSLNLGALRRRTKHISLNLQIVDVGGGTVCDVIAEPSWTVGNLKECIHAASSIPACKQCLLLDGEILDTNDSLGDRLSAEDSCISLIRQRACNAEAEEWVNRVEENWQELRDAPPHIGSDLDVILAAVQQSTYAITFVLGLIYHDREKLLAILRTDGNVFEYLANTGDAKRLGAHLHTRDREMVGIAMAFDGNLLRFASEEVRADPKFILNRVHTDGDVLRFASKQLRAARHIVHAAVCQNGKALRFASDILRSDRKIVLAAIKQDITAAKFALRFDKETLAELVSIANKTRAK